MCLGGAMGGDGTVLGTASKPEGLGGGGRRLACGVAGGLPTHALFTAHALSMAHISVFAFFSGMLAGGGIVVAGCGGELLAFLLTLGLMVGGCRAGRGGTAGYAGHAFVDGLLLGVSTGLAATEGDAAVDTGSALIGDTCLR